MALTRLALTVAAALLVAAAPASASTVRLDPGGGDESTTVTYIAGAGEANKVTAAVDGTRMTIDDPGTSSITPQQGCSSLTPKRVVCDTQDSTNPMGRIHAELGDGDDTFSMTIANTLFAAAEVRGGPGDDDLTGAQHGDILDGDSGRDELRGGDGSDSLQTSDTTGAADADLIDGGAGPDGFSGYSERTTPVRVDLRTGTGSGETGENDTLIGIDSVGGGHSADELIANDLGGNLAGGGGDDALTGSPRGDMLLAGDGNDRLFPGPGADAVDAGAGDDTIQLGNPRGTYDGYVWCMEGEDLVTELFEAFPALGIDCERADLGGGVVIGTLPRRFTYSSVAMSIPCPAAFRDANGLCAGKLVIEPRLAFRRSATTRYRTRYGAREFRFTTQSARVTVPLNARGRRELRKAVIRLQFTMRFRETATGKVREFAWTGNFNRAFLKDRGVG